MAKLNALFIAEIVRHWVAFRPQCNKKAETNLIKGLGNIKTVFKQFIQSVDIINNKRSYTVSS